MKRRDPVLFVEVPGLGHTVLRRSVATQIVAGMEQEQAQEKTQGQNKVRAPGGNKGGGNRR